MRSPTHRISLTPLLLICIILSRTSGFGEEKTAPSTSKVQARYETEIANFRTDHLKMFLQIEQAPLRTEQSRKGLRYFPANPRFRFTASFDPTPGEKALEMATSDGKMAPFTKFGRVMFTRHQKAYELTIYKRKNAEFYFIPFHDQTNGATTFGGGRFLGFSLSRVKDGQVVLDFNKSYNPWCHYAEKFACPLPPRSNKLDFAVLAGEKKYAPN